MRLRMVRPGLRRQRRFIEGHGWVGGLIKVLEKATFAESVDFVYFVYFKYVVLFSFSKEFAFIFIFHIG